MASCYGHANHDAAKREQIVTEFFAKSLHIILEARSPFMSSCNFSGETMSSPASSSSFSSSHRPRDKWFNLALRECPAELENIDFWQHCNLKPMVVDVVLSRRSLDHEPGKFYPSSKDQEERRHEKVIESVIETWVVLYENQKGKDSASSSKRSATSLAVFYKKLLVLLRSLYSTARLLPATKLSRDIISSGRLRAATLTHRLRSFIDPCIGGEEADMQRFRFTPVDSFCGRLSVYVSYKSSLPDLPLEPLTPESPQIIPDYVGSPLADPFKSFPSFPSYSPITSKNSRNTDIFRGSPAPLTHVSRTQHPPPTSLPSRLPDTSQTKYRIVGFDEKPSPTHFPHAKSLKEPLQSGCASGRVRSTQQACTALLLPSPSKPGVLRDKISGTSGPVAEKCSVRKDEIGSASRIKLSFDSSPRALFSRSSSELDYDDSGFDCPFALDEDDMISGWQSSEKQQG
ncbi:hypothetical protein Droror1_Dr00021927 [Drosera rotundifolia]